MLQGRNFLLDFFRQFGVFIIDGADFLAAQFQKLPRLDGIALLAQFTQGVVDAGHVNLLRLALHEVVEKPDLGLVVAFLFAGEQEGNDPHIQKL